MANPGAILALSAMLFVPWEKVNCELCVDTTKCHDVILTRDMCDSRVQLEFIQKHCQKFCGLCNFSRLDGGETNQRPASPTSSCEVSAEVVFVLDASSSVGNANFQKVRQFTQDVTQELKAEYQKLNVTVITFSNEAQVNLQLNESVDVSAMLALEANITYTHGGTQTHKALNLMYNSFHQNVNSSKIGIVITDGASFEPSLTRQAAENAKNHGVTIFVIAVGDDVNPHETKDISSDPDEKYLKLLRSFNDLQKIVGFFHTRNCTTTTTSTTTTSTTPTTTTTTEPTTTEQTTTTTAVPQTEPTSRPTTVTSASVTDRPGLQTGGTPTAKPVVVTGQSPTLKPPFIPPSTESGHVKTPALISGKSPSAAPPYTKTGIPPSLVPPVGSTAKTERPNLQTGETQPTAKTTTTTVTTPTPSTTTTTVAPITTIKTTTTVATPAPTTKTTTTTVPSTTEKLTTTTVATPAPTTKTTTTVATPAPTIKTTTTVATPAPTTKTTTTVATPAPTTKTTTTVATPAPTTKTTTTEPSTTAELTTTTVATPAPTIKTTTTTQTTTKLTTTTTESSTTPTTTTTQPSPKPTTTTVATTPSTQTTTTIKPKTQPLVKGTTVTSPPTPTTAKPTTTMEETKSTTKATTTTTIVQTQPSTKQTTHRPITTTTVEVTTERTQPTTTTTAQPSVKPTTATTVSTQPSTKPTTAAKASTKATSPVQLQHSTTTTQEPATEKATTTTENPVTTTTVPPTTTTASCIAKIADVVFVVDTSGSIGLANFEKVKAFIKEVIMTFDIDPRYTRVALIEYSTNARIEFKLNDKTNLTDLLDAVDNVTYSGGGTSTSDALQLMRIEGFERERPAAPDIAVVITDGLSKFPSLTRAQANLAKKDGITMFSVGIGNLTASSELLAIASSKHYVFEVGDYETLLTLDNVVAHRACGIVLPEEYHSRSTTTPSTTPKGCVDLDANCVNYPRDSCTDYEPYARKNCARKCGYCPGHPIFEPPCDDTEPNCASYGSAICLSASQYDWVDQHCRKFCSFCGNKTEIPETTVTTPTTPVVTTVASCFDIESNCAKYGGPSMCTQPSYESWAKYNCKKYCGYCYSYHTVTSATIHKVICPQWTLPEQCTLVYSGGQCCPYPKCPDGFKLTIKRKLK